MVRVEEGKEVKKFGRYDMRYQTGDRPMSVASEEILRKSEDLPSWFSQLNGSQQQMYLGMDVDQRAKFVSYWIMKHPQAIEKSEVSLPQIVEATEVNVVSTDERVFTTTRTTKDKRGYFLTETKTYIKPSSLAENGVPKTISMSLGDSKFVVYRQPEDGTLGLVSAKRGSDLSDDPDKISQHRLEQIMGWCVFLLRRQQQRYSPDEEIPRVITIPKVSREVVRKLMKVQKLNLKYLEDADKENTK